MTWENLFTAELWGSAFGTTLTLKLGVVAVILALSVYHDFVIGPRSVRVLEQATPAMTPGVLAEGQRLRRRASVIGRVEAILALMVLALAIMLVRGVPSFW